MKGNAKMKLSKTKSSGGRNRSAMFFFLFFFFRTGHVTQPHHFGRWSSPEYSGTAVPLHLISILPVRSKKRKRTAKSSPQSFGRRLPTPLCEPPNDKTNKMACAPGEDSDQLGHPPSLIRIFAVRMIWSESSLSADAQADLSVRWAHMPFCLFWHEAA